MVENDMTSLEELKKHNIWSRMHHISLAEMKNITLMNRIDTKYVTSQKLLLPILERAVANNYMVQYDKCALHCYKTTYYDTEKLTMYLMHHNRKLHRQKIRCRTYMDFGTSFLEIKDKNNKGRTNKKRIVIDSTDDAYLRGSNEAADFIKLNTAFDLDRLLPTLETHFYRVTLVNEQKTERITIDLNLKFNNLRDRDNAALEDMMIIELKQDGRYVSDMKGILNELHIKPFRLSKYCIGIAMTAYKVKANRFKYKLHLLNKIRKEHE